ncbi:MAG TPA: PQQ-binding-like beta-propeller repeat protein [Candidatus Baltobacteraceae bacterium]|nr:PQQ-binding-like beta-propeller repeat protein [Candidatus Baltobacteraceae bacterium]
MPLFLYSLTVLAVFSIAAVRAQGTYTPSEASAGATVYTQSCAQCHGANLQGQSGPTLKGASIQRAYPSGDKLYDFIRTQMPYNAPGSLSTTQYREVTAYILQQNGRLGAQAAGAARGPGRVTGKSGATKGTPPPSYEIVRVAPPSTVTTAAIPASARIDISDDMMLASTTDRDNWLVDGRSYDNSRYSPLAQITTSNVRSLVPAAIVQTGMTASFETTPIVSDGIMYLTTPTVDNQMKVFAVNAVTGAKYWQTTVNESSFQICCGPVNRGPAVAYGMVYFDTLDDKLIALDARTGRQRWSTQVADPRGGYSETLAPLAYDGMIIVGSAGGEWALRGFVAAYDARTGKQRWRWYTTVPSTYAGNSWKTGGAMPWTTPALDPQRGLLIFSTGNPNPDLNGAGRRGDNKWSDSIVALDVHSGAFKWGYQEVRHDVWDYDAVSPVVLFNVNVNGRTVPAAGEAGKVGWFFIVNRNTGALIRKSQNYVRMSKNMFSAPTKAGVDMLPGANGGAEWSPAAYSPQTHDVYVLGMDQLMRFTVGPPQAPHGHLRLGSAFRNVVPHGIQDGRFVAINVDTGRIAWTAMTPQPLIGGALVTAGNLAFMGEGDGWFDAYDARTGARVWRYQLGAGVNAPPIAYAVNGQEYIAVAAGGNFQLGYPYGDSLVIFKLPASTAGASP